MIHNVTCFVCSWRAFFVLCVSVNVVRAEWILNFVYHYTPMWFFWYWNGTLIFGNVTRHCVFVESVCLLLQISRITETTLGQLPVMFKPLIRSTLAVEPTVRPDALQLTKVCYHGNSSLRYVTMVTTRYGTYTYPIVPCACVYMCSEGSPP